MATANPNTFDDATFTDTAWTNLLTAPHNRWRTISISNLANQDLLIGFGSNDDPVMTIPSNSSERPFDVGRGFNEVWGKLAAAGTGRVTINVG